MTQGQLESRVQREKPELVYYIMPLLCLCFVFFMISMNNTLCFTKAKCNHQVLSFITDTSRQGSITATRLGSIPNIDIIKCDDTKFSKQNFRRLLLAFVWWRWRKMERKIILKDIFSTESILRMNIFNLSLSFDFLLNINN